MFGKPHTLFRVMGFEVRVDWSWLIILALIVWSLGAGYFPAQLPGWSRGTYFWMALLAAAGLFASVVLHELSHALMARRHGLKMSGITLFIFGGVAQMDDEPRRPAVEWRMALAGPVMSAVLAVTLYAMLRLGGSSWPVPVQGVLAWLAVINGILLVFNLLPAYPLDGGRILRAVLWRRWNDVGRATHAAARSGRALGLVLIILGAAQILSGAGIAGLWWVLIGLFIRFAAKQGERQVQMRMVLSGRPVRRFMTQEPVTVPPDITLQQLVEEYVYPYHLKLFPVVEDGRLVGCVTTEQLRAVPRAQWPELRVRSLERGCDEENAIHPDADAYDALRQMTHHHRSRLVVRDGEHLEGVIAMKDLMDFLEVNLELQAASR